MSTTSGQAPNSRAVDQHIIDSTLFLRECVCPFIQLQFVVVFLFPFFLSVVLFSWVGRETEDVEGLEEEKICSKYI